MGFRVEEGWEARRLRHAHAHPRLLAVQQVRDVWLENVKEQKPMGKSGKEWLSKSWVEDAIFVR